jgi:hypothetical protein
MKLVLDHHYPATIAPALRMRGLDVASAQELGWDRLSDAELLRSCADDHRTILTNNVADFMVLAREWQLDRERHSGLILTSDRQWPRTKDMSGRFVDALTSLMEVHRADDSLSGTIIWL